jgi:hypothetical protein
MEHAAAVERVLHGARVKARVVLRLHSFLCVGPVVASSDSSSAWCPATWPRWWPAMSRWSWWSHPCSSPVSISRWPGITLRPRPGQHLLRGVFVSLFDGLKVEPPGARAAAS